MANSRFKSRALIASDLLFVAAATVMLVRIASTASSTNISLHPFDDPIQVAALDLFQAQRLAVNSGKPVEVRFDQRDGVSGYSISAANRKLGFYRLPERRSLAGEATFSRPAVTFLPGGGASADVTIAASSNSSDRVVVSRTGEVRIEN